MRDPKSEARRWFRQAEYDLANARYNCEGEFYAVACFQAQQAAEKAYKAFLLSRGERIIPSHSVVELRRDSEKYEKRFVDLRSTGKLDSFYTPTRYPNALPGGLPAEVYDKSDAEEAISLATEVVETVRSLLGDQDDG